MEDCAICFETLEENIINKWSCNHKFHSNCIKQWKKNSCPLCRITKLNNQNIKSNNQNILDINKLKNICKNLEGDIKEIYLELFNDKDCITNNHNLICLEKFGVKIICEDCNTIQCFNRLH